MKLVEKTCQNPNCGHVEELPEEARWCPKCEWEVRPWSFDHGSKKKEEESLESKLENLGLRIKIEKRKRRVGLICPHCGCEYPGWRSKVWAKQKGMALAEKKRKEELYKKCACGNRKGESDGHE